MIVHMRSITALLLLSFVCGSETLAYAVGEPKNILVQLVKINTNQSIPGFSLDNKDVVLTSFEIPESYLGVTLSGRILTQGRQIFLGTRAVVPENKAGDFHIRVPLLASVTPVDFKSPSDVKNLKSPPLLVQFELRCKNWAAIQEREKKRLVPRALSFQLGVGLSRTQYTSALKNNYSQLGITPKVGANYVLKPRSRDLGLNAFVTALPFSASGPTSNSIRYFGANLRYSHTFDFVKDPWTFSLAGGLYYSTMLSAPSGEGYPAVSGPQLYPVLSRWLARDKKISTYFKFSPISAGPFSFKELHFHEIAMGMSYSFPVSSSVRRTSLVSITLDYATLKLSTPLGDIDNNALTVGAGMSF